MRANQVSRILGIAVLAVAGFGALPSSLCAQSAIAGLVKDSTGAILPGVTVEAASPALTEKTRTVVTDDQGQYQIIDLRPGVYSVTFTLPGFNTVKREEIELPANFTAAVNGEMRVGAVEETVTVSGQTPVVDVQRALQQNVMSREILDSVPMGRSMQAAAATTPGVMVSRPDVGGSEFRFYTNLTVHGSLAGDQAYELEGMPTHMGNSDGQVMGMYRDEGDNQEVVYQVSAIPAEQSRGGVRVNFIGKEGSNSFRGDVGAYFTPGSLQSDNFTDDLQQRGLRAPNTMKRINDFNVSGGGPLLPDRLWFYSSFRHIVMDKYAADSFYPDGRQAVDDSLHVNVSTRLTLQASERNKVMAFYAGLPRRILYHRDVGAGGVAPEASNTHSTPNSWSTQVKWTSTISSKLLFEAGFSQTKSHYRIWDREEVKPTDIARQDLILGTRWVASGQNSDNAPRRRNFVTALSYVSGSHAIKTGLQSRQGAEPLLCGPEGRHGTAVPQRRALFRSGVQHADRSQGERAARPGALRPGRLDAQSIDPQPWHPVRGLQCLDSGAAIASRPVRRRAPLRGHSERGEPLEGCDAAIQRRLRSVRRCEHGDQGQHQQVHGRTRHRVRRYLQPARERVRSAPVDR